MLARLFAEQGLKLAEHKVVLLFPKPRLNAAHWLWVLPLARVWLLTPRPSIPAGEVIARGEKPENGRQDFCWLVFEHGHRGRPELSWLHRDESAQ